MKAIIASWAVELRLGKIRQRLAQDLVGLAQLAVLAFKGLDPGAVLRRGAAAKALVTFGLPHPAAKRLAGASDLTGNRVNRCPLRRMLGLVIQNHPHRPRP